MSLDRKINRIQFLSGNLLKVIAVPVSYTHLHNPKSKKGAQVMRKNEKITALYERLSRCLLYTSGAA